MTAIISLLVVLVLLLTVTRVASVALRLTGMAPDAARFQALSAFTGSGFTITEGATVTKLATLGVGLLAVYLLASSSVVDRLMCGATSWLAGEATGA